MSLYAKTFANHEGVKMVTDIQRNKQILTQRTTVYQWEVKTHTKCKDVHKIEIKNVGLKVVIVMFPLPSL